jgi:hypothetical protein
MLIHILMAGMKSDRQELTFMEREVITPIFARQGKSTAYRMAKIEHTGIYRRLLISFTAGIPRETKYFLD